MTQPTPTPSLSERGRGLLNDAWSRVCEGASATDLPGTVADAIGHVINSSTKTYRYVLPTHLLAKLADPAIDCRSVQDSSPLDRSFDARSFCTAVIVPFDRNNHNVLGGSGDPYVSNPLRIAHITAETLSAQRNKKDFSRLIDVLTYVQNQPECVEDALLCVLNKIKDRLSRTAIVYPAPNRASLDDAVGAIVSYMEARTGGRRMQAVVVALFQVIGERFGLFDRVDSAHVNSADARSGNAGDINCFDAEGNLVLAVDAKDRQLEMREVQTKLPAARQQDLTELLFVIRGGVRPSDQDELNELRERQFRSGHNIYHCEFDHLLLTCGILFGEEGRRDLLEKIGATIDEYGELQDREAWAAALATL